MALTSPTKPSTTLREIYLTEGIENSMRLAKQLREKMVAAGINNSEIIAWTDMLVAVTEVYATPPAPCK